MIARDRGSSGVIVWYHPLNHRRGNCYGKDQGFNASGALYTESGRTISIDSFTLGARVLLTCDVTGLPEGSEVIRYK